MRTKPSLFRATIGAMLALSVAAVAPAYADDDDDHHKHRKGHHQYYDNGYGHHEYRHSRGRHYERKFLTGYKQKHASKRIRLNIPVKVYGSDRLGLRRLARDYHGIDVDQYQLRKVIVHNHGKHHKGYGSLRVGYYESKPQHLDYGANHFRVGDSDGRWVLDLQNAKVDRIQLVLEPKYQHYAGYASNRGGDKYSSYKKYPTYRYNRYRFRYH